MRWSPSASKLLPRGGDGTALVAGAETVDNLAVAHEAELLPGEALEIAVGATKPEDPLAQTFVLAQQAEDILRERAPLAMEAPQLEEAPAAENGPGEQRDQWQDRGPEGRTADDG